jgi:hypothetical protein
MIDEVRAVFVRFAIRTICECLRRRNAGESCEQKCHETDHHLVYLRK